MINKRVINNSENTEKEVLSRLSTENTSTIESLFGEIANNFCR